MLNPSQYRSWGFMESRGQVCAVKSTRDMEVVFPFFVPSSTSASHHHPHPRSTAHGHGFGRALNIKQEPHLTEENLHMYPPTCFSDRRGPVSPPCKPPMFGYPHPSLGTHDRGDDRLQRQLPSSGKEAEDLRVTADHSDGAPPAKMSLIVSRARREFVPEEKKDDLYWAKRIKNNASARRSRVKRKAMEMESARRLLELERINLELRQELATLKRRFGLAAADCVGLQTPPPMPGDAEDSLDRGGDGDRDDDDDDDDEDDDRDDDAQGDEVYEKHIREQRAEAEEMESCEDREDEKVQSAEEQNKACVVLDTPPASLPPLSPNSLSSTVSNRSWSPASQSSLSPRADAVLPLKCRLKQFSAFHGVGQSEGERAAPQVH